MLIYALANKASIPINTDTVIVVVNKDTAMLKHPQLKYSAALFGKNK